MESRRGGGQIGGGINGERAPLKKGGKRFKIEFVTGSKAKVKRGSGQADGSRGVSISSLNEGKRGRGGQPDAIVQPDKAGNRKVCTEL